MKNIFVLLICVSFVTLVMAQEDVVTPSAPSAVEQNAVEIEAPTMMPLEMHKTGTVSVPKDANGKVTAVKLLVNGYDYDVQLDDEGKKLEAMGGKRVTVNCTLNNKGDKKVLTVKSVVPAVEITAPLETPTLAVPEVTPVAIAPAGGATNAITPATNTPAECEINADFH